MFSLDYSLFPPEFNSARMYMGAGSGPMIAAASAWSGLASELGTLASSYSSVVSGLTGGSWTGPSSTAMATAAAPYVAWMSNAASQAARNATAATQAASAYESAFAATVPPVAVAANRAQLMMLVATNLLGQNTPAIAATEAEYGEMWAQDAGAMYGYQAASSAVTSQVTPWSGPAQSTTLGGMAAQHASVASSMANAAGTQSAALPQAMTVPAASSGTTTGTTATGTSSLSSGLSSLLGSSSGTSLLTSLGPTGALIGVQGAVYGMMVPTQMMGTFSQMANMAKTVPMIAGAAAKPLQLAMHGLGNGLGSSPPATAAMTGANKLGALSVPRGWAVPPINTAATPLGAVPGGTVTGSGNMLGGLPLTGTGGANGSRLAGVNDALQLPSKRFTMPRPVAAG